MGRGKTLAPEVRWIIVRLSTFLSKDDIAIYTDIPLRSIERILQYYHDHGTVKDDDKRAQVTERKTHLRDVDIQVSLCSNLTY
jgi:predicted methyltransferase